MWCDACKEWHEASPVTLLGCTIWCIACPKAKKNTIKILGTNEVVEIINIGE